ncbi:molybdenum cofactor biosynthesis protein B [Pelagibacterium flavum]|uniref:Molybdenum cofactor biosynthesis protein B n=1 Tax=Pelagibacterium flavum TaxID=2984530 RepID=A0ABY6ILW7_9HYPH|nr:molybdenum cofactor biosynthesis protein B [Pelagibacterium sp. YIM 151497]MAN89183.1 molybdenum cofactor biosynthesis protein B [Algoriphagus sp.]UYQ71486.1 molybdenum cofactor biosynthesis protein B [Pelagibacterium sp. YIM 151497]|tara:strand:- start:473 stop:1009 length:537 start_codon:yes stop_codon:yes gene_type:complete
MFPYKIDDSHPFVPVTFAILAVSDTRTLETDTSGALLREMIEGDGHRVFERAVVTDDRDAIANQVKAWVEEEGIDVVLTTGGTGFSGRDVTPEAVEPLFDKRMDGFSVLFHQYSATTIGTSSIQSRTTAGLIGTTFVFCLPGSRGACRDAWEAILKYQFDSRHVPCNFIEVMPRLNER